MNESWQRAGTLVEPAPQGWAHSHAALPATDGVDETGFWIYYSPRDADNRAHISRTRVDVDGDRLAVREHDAEPVLGPGELGAFDDCGVTMSCVLGDGDRKLLYYTGWTLVRTVPFHFFVGLAVSEDGGGTFRRPSAAPLLERSHVDPYMTASPSVLRDGGSFRMWYVSCVGWTRRPEGAQHRYHVRYAESDDGVAWRRAGRVSIDFDGQDEYAMGRPHVIKEGGLYRMWFCVRGTAYRLAYAESPDGLEWVRRDDELGLPTVAGEWDSEMQAYPTVVDAGGRRFLLYNGNGYGRSGIGYAAAAVRP